MIKRAFLFLSIAAFALPLPAKILYFETTGSDSNTCTFTAPCRSFLALGSHGVTLSDGDTALALDSVDFTANGTSQYQFGNITIDGGAHGAFITGSPASEGNAALQLTANTAANMIRNATVIVPNASSPVGIAFLLNAGGLISFENVSVVLQGPAGAMGISGLVTGSSAIGLTGSKSPEPATELFRLASLALRKRNTSSTTLRSMHAAPA